MMDKANASKAAKREFRHGERDFAKMSEEQKKEYLVKYPQSSHAPKQEGE